MQVFSFPAWSVFSIYLSHPITGVKVAIAAVAVLAVAISDRDGATIGDIGGIAFLVKLDALNSSDGEC